jgi:hypothetical protein
MQSYHLGTKQNKFHNFWRPTQFVMQFTGSQLNKTKPKTLKSAMATRIWRSQAPRRGPRRPSRPGLSQGRPLALTRHGGAARAHPRYGPRANARAQCGVAAAGDWAQPRARAGRGRCAREGPGVAGVLTCGTDCRSKASGGGTAKSGGAAGWTPRGSCEGKRTPVRAGVERGGAGGATRARDWAGTHRWR